MDNINKPDIYDRTDDLRKEWRESGTWPYAVRVGNCVAIGPDRIIVASAINTEWADKIATVLAHGT